jgi:hypothetical protein
MLSCYQEHTLCYLPGCNPVLEETLCCHEIDQCKRSKADVCLFFEWTPTGLLRYLSWVDDILIAGSKASVMKAKASLRKHFTLDEQGEMQDFSDEFDLPHETAVIPAKHGVVMSKYDGVAACC